MGQDFSRFFRPGRVHRRIYTDPGIFELEMVNIFGKAWIYIGHESQVKNPGDYFATHLGRRPVVMVRDEEGQVRVIHNQCAHRGAMVVATDKGNAPEFTCCYHGWTYHLDGRLKAVPLNHGYPKDFDPNNPKTSMRAVPRVKSYRGFVFASFDPDVEDLVGYLAGAREYLDLAVDALGDAEIITGTNEYAIDANWKLLAENSIDGYHAVPTHDTYFKYLVALGTDLSGGVAGSARALGNGHGVVEYAAPWGRPVAKWEPLFGETAREEIDRIRTELVDRHGEERTSRMADTNRNLLIYPNLVVNDIMAVTVRTFFPVAADRMEVTAWELAPRDELPQLRQRRLDSFLTFLGPGGFATPDDIEALESCQQGFRSGGVEWNDLSRGMARDPRT
ncbi:MAG: aromatic ring-hydroxylating oxygenase subunit alpha, partial [Stackebrandtia sp.]